MNTTQKHTPREVADFILGEVLRPFIESVLYDDYQKDWEARHENNDIEAEEFNKRYDEALRFVEATPDLLAALEQYQRAYAVWNARKDGGEDDLHAANQYARAAIANVKGVH